jgi:hypothetical protein
MISIPTAAHRRLALQCAFASWLLLALLTLAAPQGLHFFDPVLPLRAMLQWQDGLSPNWNTLLRVDPADLTRDQTEWLGWWAPGTSLLLLPGLAAGFAPGHLLRALALAAILVGSLGWTRWFARQPLPRVFLFGFAISIPWIRYDSSNLFRYSAEALAFAAAPWAFNALADRFNRTDWRRPLSLALLGLALGFTYWLKFSLFLTVLAAVGAIFIWRWRQLPPAVNRFADLRSFALFGACLGLAPLGWQLFDRLHGGVTPLAAPRALAWSLEHLLFAIANPALALADAFGPFFFVFVHPGLLGLGGKSLGTVAWLGLPGGVLLIALLARAVRRRFNSAEVALAAFSVAGMTLLLAGLWIFADVDHMPRHVAQVSLAALPIALAEACAVWSSARHRVVRPALAVAGLVYIAGPLAFGFCYVAAKLKQGDGATLSRHALALWSTAADEHLLTELRDLHRADPSAVLVVPDPEMALLWPGRAIWSFAGRNVGEDLQHSYHGVSAATPWSASAPVAVHVLLPRNAELPSPLRHERFIVSAPPWKGTHFKIVSGRLLPQ